NTDDQAYWKLTRTDGTVYLYGANRLPNAFGGTGADAPTYATWSEPVFGTGSGTTCNDPTGSAAPTSCRRAWRWNLDSGIAATGITSANASAFPDVPYDQHCDATSTTCTTYSPTFYATVRLTGVRTSVNNGAPPRTAQPAGTPAGYLAVDAYKFPQAFPPPQDYSTGASGNRAQLRLEEIDHTGYLTNSDGNTTATDAPPVRLSFRRD